MAATAGRSGALDASMETLPPTFVVRCRCGLLLATTLLPLLLSSCFTMGLWGFTPETERDAFTGKEESTFAYDEETEWSWQLFCLRVLLTPVTVGLDCLTCPVQAVLFFADDDDDGCSDR